MLVWRDTAPQKNIKRNKGKGGEIDGTEQNGNERGTRAKVAK